PPVVAAGTRRHRVGQGPAGRHRLALSRGSAAAAMFDIGFTELLLIAVVALVVLGPERLPKAARFAGLWVRRARAQWYSVKSELERELAADELKRSLHDARQAAADLQKTMQETEAEMQAKVSAAEAEARREIESLRR